MAGSNGRKTPTPVSVAGNMISPITGWYVFVNYRSNFKNEAKV